MDALVTVLREEADAQLSGGFQGIANAFASLADRLAAAIAATTTASPPAA